MQLTVDHCEPAGERRDRAHALERRRGKDTKLEDIDVPRNRSWRPFQLAFVLLSIPSLARTLHKDRTEPLAADADLLWFPTGGGKTEAYLGVAAFTMAIRRMQGTQGEYDGSRGLAVIMRYTLRLLTLQQFQRAVNGFLRESSRPGWRVFVPGPTAPEAARIECSMNAARNGETA